MIRNITFASVFSLQNLMHTSTSRCYHESASLQSVHDPFFSLETQLTTNVDNFAVDSNQRLPEYGVPDAVVAGYM